MIILYHQYQILTRWCVAFSTVLLHCVEELLFKNSAFGRIDVSRGFCSSQRSSYDAYIDSLRLLIPHRCVPHVADLPNVTLIHVYVPAYIRLLYHYQPLSHPFWLGNHHPRGYVDRHKSRRPPRHFRSCSQRLRQLCYFPLMPRLRTELSVDMVTSSKEWDWTEMTSRTSRMICICLKTHTKRVERTKRKDRH